jgi:purine-binding chemotaxis protein CheW
MKNPPNSSEQALEDYFDDLLSEPAAALDAVSASAAVDVLIAPEELLQPMPPLRTARLAHLPLRNMAAPASALASSVATPLRAYAEPIRTLNLRMPLPPPAARPAVVEVPVAPPVQLQPTLKTEPEVAPVVVAPEPAIAVEALVAEPLAEQLIEEEVLATQVLETQLLETVAAEPVPWLANGRPGWAQRPFECLLFRVGGLGLVAPLAELGSIYKLEPGALTSIFGQAPWFMGLLPVKEGYNIRVIDAAQVVMPERYTPELREQYRYVISLHGSDWGLAVDAVADSIMLQPDDVRWRSQRGKRPWLAGTVIERMCALLDVAQLVWMFENQDGKRGAPRV